MSDKPSGLEAAGTHVQETDVLGAQLNAFRQDPSDQDLFRELRRGLRKKARNEELAQLCELRAPFESNEKEAVRLWLDAANLRFALSQEPAAELDLYRVLQLDPAHEKAAQICSQRRLDKHAYAEAAGIIEAEIKALESEVGNSRSTASRRLAVRCRTLAPIWQENLGRLDKALACWERSFELEPKDIETLRRSREICQSLGDQDKVRTLLKTELQLMGSTGDRALRASAELALGQLERRHGQHEAAAEHLNRSLQLGPESSEAKEALAEVLSELGGEQAIRKAGAIFAELAERELQHENVEGATRFLSRALTSDPQAQHACHLQESLLRKQHRWHDLAGLYERQILDGSRESAEQERLLQERALLCEKHLEDRQGLKDCLRQLAALPGREGQYQQRLRPLLEEDGEGEDVARLVQTQIERTTPDDPNMIALLLDLARVYREQIGDRERAALTLHKVLSYDPAHSEALTRYSEHFRERRDWRGLVDLYEYTLNHLRGRGAPVLDLVETLETIAELCERKLGDVDQAILTWKRIEEIEGPTAKTQDAIHRLLAHASTWQSLVAVLEQEAQQSTTPSGRANALRRIAQLYRERQVNPLRSISLYEEVVVMFPGDDLSLRALAELYDKQGNNAGLAHTIRRQLDLAVNRLDTQDPARRSGAERSWPVAKRVERITALRRLGSLYETYLADVDGVVYAGSGLLEILPGDREALERMERVLDKAGDSERLVQTLEYHVGSSASPVERCKLLRRLAQLAEQRSDEVGAMERWEQVLRSAPNDSEALAKLADHYERLQRHQDLADVLARSLLAQNAHPAQALAAAQASGELKRLARVLDTKLGDATRAIGIWQRVLAVAPIDAEALDALCRLQEASEQWRDLADTLARAIPTHLPGNPERAAALALQRARLLDEHLGSPDLAAQALEYLIAIIDPTHAEAHRQLQKIYENRGSFEAMVRVSERQFALSDNEEGKIELALSIGASCRDRLEDPIRALQAFKRVLDRDPSHLQALLATAELSAKVGRWREHVSLMETLCGSCSDLRERRGLMLRIAKVNSEHLLDHRKAFEWTCRAHELSPDAQTLSELRHAAQTHGLWRELANVYEGDREQLREHDRVSDPQAFVGLCKDIAEIADAQLADPQRAMNALLEALAIAPQDLPLIFEAERIAADSNRRHLWDKLLECFSLALTAAHGEHRVQLTLRQANVRETRLRDLEGSLDDLLMAFSWSCTHEDVHKQLYGFGERHRGFWQRILSTETALAERASETVDRVAILRRKAVAYEDRANDLVRSFRSHMSAFILAPDNDTTLAHLWRLAGKIGKYTDSQKIPEIELAAARIKRPRLPAPAHSTPPSPSSTRAPRREPTQELSISDLLDEDFSVPSPVLSDERISNDSLGPPAPPPRRPESRPNSPQSATLTAALRHGSQESAQSKTQPSSQSLPSSPRQAYSSPWSELASVYCKLPYANQAERLRWHFRACEVWEKGACEVERAFETLSLALAFDARHPETHERLGQLAKAHDNWNHLADLYIRAADETSAGDDSAEFLMQVAAIRTSQKRPQEVEIMLRRVLSMRPHNTDARESLENLYRSEERWIDLAAQLEERTDPRLGSAVPLGERPSLLRELSHLYSEQLSRPHDALETLERLLDLEPENLPLLSDIASAYENISRWRKAISTLERIATSAGARSIGREARFRIGEIYESKLELPDRAIEAFTLLVTDFPGDEQAFRALDRLLQEHSRWNDLDAILLQQASLVREPEDRARLLHRRARLLMQWLHDPEEAAAALRHARTIDPENRELESDLTEALLKAERYPEAASILKSRISKLRASGREEGAPKGELAALLVRLGSLCGESLSDPEGARALLNEALALVPSHPSALASLARLAKTEQDPRAFAKARLREAHATSDADARIDALLDAGKSFRGTGDLAAARSAFEEILALRPYHAETTWALSALVHEGGDIDGAITLLSTRLGGATLDGPERAQVLTQLAALSRQAGADSEAELRLREAIGHSPEHLPAILSLADLLFASQRWQELEEFLVSAMSGVNSESTETRAELLRRLASAYEGLDQPDKAYQTLISGERLHRGNLIMKLALGENRYRARRWREAALHLGALADHPDAHTHPSEVATGLYHAALAEIRSRHSDKAEPLYRAALVLKSNFGPALEALAELEMERGNVATAVGFLETQADATEAAQQRLMRYETLGDICISQLDDEPRAISCYESALQSAEPIDVEHIDLLRKLLARYVSTGQRVECGRTSSLLASLTSDAQERCEQHLEAALHFQSASSEQEARSSANCAVSASPYNVRACEIASHWAMAADDHKAAAAMLGRLLNHRDGSDAGDDSGRFSLLWSRLADARSARGDSKSALLCYEKALQIAPNSKGAHLARGALSRLWNADPSKSEPLLALRKTLASDSLAAADIAQWARSERNAHNIDTALCALELARTQGYQYDDEDVAFLARHTCKLMAQDEAYKGVINDSERQALLADACDEPLATICEALWESAALLWPSVEVAFTRSHVKEASRIQGSNRLRASTVFTRIARALSAPATVLYTSSYADAPDIQVVCASPPAVIFGPRLLVSDPTAAAAVSDLELRFLLARAAEQVRPTRIIASGLPRKDWQELVKSLGRIFGSAAGEYKASAEQQSGDKKLRSTLPLRARSRLEKLFRYNPGASNPDEADKFWVACERAADRAGLLLCGDMDSALRHASSESDRERLMRMPMQQEYMTARARLGMSAKPL